MKPGAITSVTSITAVTWARLLSSSARRHEHQPGYTGADGDPIDRAEARSPDHAGPDGGQRDRAALHGLDDVDREVS